MKIERLKWDSDFFKLNVGACYLKKELSLNLEMLEVYDLIYLYDYLNKINFDDLHFKNHSIRFMSTTQTYEWKNNHSQTPQLDHADVIEILPYTESPNIRLKSLALLSGSHSRFKLDPMFSNNQFDLLYRKSLLLQSEDQTCLSHAGINYVLCFAHFEFHC